jgi:hypothetical protein
MRLNCGGRILAAQTFRLEGAQIDRSHQSTRVKGSETLSGAMHEKFNLINLYLINLYLMMVIIYNSNFTGNHRVFIQPTIYIIIINIIIIYPIVRIQVPELGC